MSHETAPLIQVRSRETDVHVPHVLQAARGALAAPPEGQQDLWGGMRPGVLRPQPGCLYVPSGVYGTKLRSGEDE